MLKAEAILKICQCGYQCNRIYDLLRGKVMENVLLKAVYLFNNTEGTTELKILADSIEQRNGWVLALWNDRVVAGVKEEYLKAFYLEANK